MSRKMDRKKLCPSSYKIWKGIVKYPTEVVYDLTRYLKNNPEKDKTKNEKKRKKTQKGKKSI